MDMQRNNPPGPRIDFIPITSANVALLAWEVYEVTTNRHAQQEILKHYRTWTPGDAAKANEAFQAWVSELGTKTAGYRQSIAHIAERRKLAVTTRLDELERLALDLRPEDKLVCHVAMLRCYMALGIAVAVANASCASPTAKMREALKHTMSYEVQLYQLEREMAYLAVAEYRKRGLPVDEWFLVANPFGSDGGAPRWEINP